MSQHVKDVTAKAHEIINNIKDAAVNGDITWAQRDELLRIVYNDVADAAGLATAQALLAAWS